MTSRTALRAGLWSAALLAAATVAAPSYAADMIGNCEVTGQKGQFPLTPAKEGQLTVETSLPAPGWWNGDTPESIADGYEYCMAANIAHRAGLDKVEVVNVAWDPLVAGLTKDFDLALSQISITPDRAKVVDFSVPYFNSDIGVLVKSGTAMDAAGMKQARIGVQGGTTGAAFVDNVLKPETPASVFPDTPSMSASLMAGQTDAAMTDTAIVLGIAAESDGRFEVIGQYHTGEVYGAIYQKGNANNAVLDQIIQSMIDDGTLAGLAKKYLADLWGSDPTAVPVWNP
jgi:polar amino acid transport system substrate-binding protein